MTPARFQTIEEIFHAALGQELDQIGRFVETACEGDELLRRKVEALLASHQRAGSFIETPAAGIASIIENRQADLLVGRTIGHYKISKRIGAGGMGEVYLATDITAGRKAALKLLPMRFTGDAERLKRFQQEARAVVGLNHPNILTVYEIGEDHSAHYIASELIEGETLRERLTRGRMQLSEAVDVAIQVARALAAAHEAGIVHRDIKPENIMLRPDGYVKVLDFGIAKLAEQEMPVTMAEEEAVLLVETNLGSILGTVRYMSPEQARGAPVDKCTDIWSLGVVLYEMAAGRAPFTGDTPREVMASILGTEPPPLTSSKEQTPVEFQHIVSKALFKARAKRYQSAQEMLEALKSLRRGMEFKAELERSNAAPPWRRWTRSPTVLLLILLVATLVLVLQFYWHRNLTTYSIPEKSIAVLPFENLSDNKENSDFAAGIQDDVLTSLAQIHELKVISRTSVMVYKKGDGRNVREIAGALGVANVVEGSVRREGNRVLVNVQLIDARNDRHLWAERYDRTVADSIGLQGELATQIAVALKATLAPEEKARLGVEPTANSEAYVLYLTALGKEGTDEIAAEQLYMRATALDPKFALAYARASILNSRISGSMSGDRRAPRAKARAQAEEAMRLSPTLGEAHMALGVCLYWGEKKYDAALKEFELAAATSPNNAEIYTYVGGIYRRQGRWREAVESFERALSLDPRNARVAFREANNYLYVRDWPHAIAGFNRVLKIAADSDAEVGLAYLEVVRNNNPAAGSKILQTIPAGREGDVASARWDLAMLERDYATAEKIVTESPLEDFPRAGDDPKTFYQGRVALARGDIESAQRYFAAATPVLEGWLRDNPDDPERHELLGLLYAYMHRKEDALREGRRAVELEPESQNAFHGALWAANLALVYALVGEQDQAITLIERLLSTPGPIQWLDHPQNITLAELRLRWEWDSLRSNPRFQKILAAPEPKTNLTNITQAAPAAPEKSIAVLPFENLSDDKANSYFAAGVQDEILSNLARIADLKVISRTSANLYKSGNPRNSREIGQQLGVAHLLEGSVQRAGHRLRVNAQLVDARTDVHLWAQTYDRDVADIFATQSEIAKTIAEQLRAKISPAESAAMTKRATNDVIAARLYAQALEEESQANLLVAAQLFDQAVARDPQFVRAYCHLSKMHLALYFSGEDHTSARRDLALAAMEKAARLEPDAGEVHLARARYFYHGFREYDRARAELDLARRTLPNDASIYFQTAAIDRRQGRFAEALRNFDRAVELDPRNREFLEHAATTYHSLHRYAEAARFAERMINISPGDYWARLGLASQALDGRADPRPLREELVKVMTEQPSTAREISGVMFECARLERDLVAVSQALALIPSEGMRVSTNFVFPREWFAARVAQASGNAAKARDAFIAARAIAENIVRNQPEDAPGWSLLGRIDAALGRKQEAIAEGRRACELLPISKDAWAGVYYVKDLAVIYASTGERDLAFEQLALLTQKGLHYGELKLDAVWDALRSDSRFEKLVASLAPKD